MWSKQYTDKDEKEEDKRDIKDVHSSENSNPESLEYVEVEVSDIDPPNSIPRSDRNKVR